MRLVHNYHQPASTDHHIQANIQMNTNRSGVHGLSGVNSNQTTLGNQNAFKSQRMLSFKQRPLTAHPTYKSAVRPQTGNPMNR